MIFAHASLAQSQGPTPGPHEIGAQKQQETTSNKQNPNSTNSVSGNSTIQIDRNIDAKKTNASSADYTTKQGDDTSTNWYIMLATWVLAGCAAVQIVAMILQYCTMRKQAISLQQTVQSAREAAEDTQRLIAQATRSADATQMAAKAARKSADSLQATERAYLFVNINLKGSPLNDDPGENAQIPIEIYVRNLGKTPAILVSLFIYPEVSNIHPSQITRHLSEYEIPPGVVVSAGGNHSYPANIRIGENWNRIINGEMWIVCHVLVRYRSVITNSIHETSFLGEYPAPGNKTRAFGISDNIELNKWT